jgi:AhpD family alkylhydroperoxidase
MLDWNQYGKQLGAAVGTLAQAAPEAVRGFSELDRASNMTKHLDAKTRELIAIAVAVTTRCDGCINAHVGAALKSGASREEIGEALGVAIALNAGAALVYSARAMDAVGAKSERAAAE